MLQLYCGVPALEYIALGDFVNKWLRVRFIGDTTVRGKGKLI